MGDSDVDHHPHRRPHHSTPTDATDTNTTAAAGNTEFYASLLVLRYLCALHLLVAAIFPGVSTLSLSATIETSFLCFLSGFTLTHRYASPPQSSIPRCKQPRRYEPQLFYLRRFCTIVPFHTVSVLVHALFFSSSSTTTTFMNMVVRTVITVCFLSPYVASSSLSSSAAAAISFPSFDAPYIAPNLIPSLALAYLIFPPIMQLLPRPRPRVKPIVHRGRRHPTASADVDPNRYLLMVLMATFYLVTAVQAYSLLLRYRADLMSLSLFEYLLYIPFSTNLPAFLCGVVVALFRLSSISHSPALSTSEAARQVTRLSLRLVASVAVLVSAVVLCSFLIHPSPSLLSFWFSTGLLLPLFAVTVCTATSLSSLSSTTSSPATSSPSSPSQLFISRSIPHASTFCLTFYLTSVPFFRLLSRLICSHNSVGHSLLCLPPIAAPLDGAPVSTLSTYSSLPAPVSIATFSGDRVSPLFFFPLCIVFSFFIHSVIVIPLLSILRSAIDWLVATARHARHFSSTWTHQPILSFVIEKFFQSVAYSSPQRDLTPARKAGRVILYYLSLMLFTSFVFRLSIIPTLDDNTISTMFSVLNIGTHRNHPVNAGTGAGGRSLGWIYSLLSICRWIIFFNAPPMICTAIGHLLFPRALWKHLPLISTSLSTHKSYLHRSLESGTVSVSNTLKHKSNIYSSNKQQPTNNLIINVSTQFSSHSPSSSSTSTLLSLPPSPSSPSSSPTSSSPSPLSPQYNLATSNELDYVLYLRYVTRGNNPHLVARNVRRAISVMHNCDVPWDMWHIEIVTDIAMDFDNFFPDPRTSTHVTQVVVPDSYVPPHGTKFKARALQYTIHHSAARLHDWIVHLDEETTFDEDTIRAVLHHCTDESTRTFVHKRQRWPRIGQGLLVYGHFLPDADDLDGDNDGDVFDMDMDVNVTSTTTTTSPHPPWVLTLADCGRVADDCGRFRLQYEFGAVWGGMHGSFVVVNNSVERFISFDHGADGSIAEDAFFALSARANGVRFAWIDALMFEQSPFTWYDLIKQRARWLVGGILVVTSSAIPWYTRSTMAILILAWVCMPFTYPTLVACNLLLHASPFWFNAVVSTLTAISVWNYVLGFIVSFQWYRLGPIRFVTFLAALLALLPCFAIAESLAVCYALVNFRKYKSNFHVVQKDIAHEPKPQQQSQPHSQTTEAEKIITQPQSQPNTHHCHPPSSLRSHSAEDSGMTLMTTTPSIPSSYGSIR